MVTFVTETLGSVLDRLADKVVKEMYHRADSARISALEFADKGHEIGLSWQFEASRQARLVIEKCKNDYKASLDTTMDRVTSDIQNVVATIDQLVNGITHHQKDAVLEIAARVEQIITRFPLINKNPCVYKTTPSFIAGCNGDHEILVQFFGHFPQDPKVTATFSVGSQTFTPTGDLHRLMCKVPYKVFCPAFSQESSLAEGKLELAWTENSKDKKTLAHTLWMGIVPPTPGKFIIEYDRPITKTITKEFVSSEFVQRSGKKGGGKTILDKHYEVPAEEGWKIVRGSGRFIVMIKRERNSSWIFVSDDRDKMIYKVSTIHVKRKGQSGQVHFKIAFNQQKEEIAQEVVSEDLSLRWRETKVIDTSKGALKKIVFVSFDGMQYEMSGVNSSNPFAKVTNQGGKLVLSVVSPESLSFFTSVPSSKA